MARNTNGTGFSLKDHLFNEAKVRYLAECVLHADETFLVDEFVDEVMTRLVSLELKARIAWIAVVLHNYLPKDFVQACSVIVAALPPPLDPTLTDNDFGDFIFAPLGEYVVRFGADEITVSLQTLRELTMRFSMEDAIRYFINTSPTEAFQTLETWSHDSQYHVRRLVSEGTRPRLPWSARLNTPYHSALPYLDTLYADPARYVTRSVANHLNDITKVDPDLVLETLARWKREGKQSPAELAWMTKHALRTLIKSGNVRALSLLGYEPSSAKVINATVTPARMFAGQMFTIEATLQSDKVERLTIDYRIGFVKKNGAVAYKTYKLTTADVEPNKSLLITKNHRLRKDATTYTLYEGEHSVMLVINGTEHLVGSLYLEL